MAKTSSHKQKHRGTGVIRPDLCRNADLSFAVLRGADLGAAHLGGTDLNTTNLSYADLAGSDLRGANLSGANLINAIIWHEQLEVCESLKGATILMDRRTTNYYLEHHMGGRRMCPTTSVQSIDIYLKVIVH